MKKAFIIILAAALVFAAVSCKSSAAKEEEKTAMTPIVDSFKEYKYSIDANGNEMVFTIEGNPTTGYQWVLLTEDDAFETVSSDYVPNENPAMMVGVGGNYKFVIDFKADGVHELDFSYRRPWEPSDGFFDLNMKVTVKGNVITDVKVGD